MPKFRCSYCLEFAMKTFLDILPYLSELCAKWMPFCYHFSQRNNVLAYIYLWRLAYTRSKLHIYIFHFMQQYLVYLKKVPYPSAMQWDFLRNIFQQKKPSWNNVADMPYFLVTVSF